MEIVKDDMSLVIVGHVDHGKSTIMGRLLTDTDSLPKGKLEQTKEMCARNSKPFEYAFLLDALKDEQSQGITIDAARIFFSTKTRNYIILDAPGHIEFLKNMITGASRAEAALLVIDAEEGIQENSRRHAYMLSLLGIKQIAVVVNKMDLVSYSEERFNAIAKDFTEFLATINVAPKTFIPVSGREGDNIAKASINTPWYKGESVLGVLGTFEASKAAENMPFRMYVQDVYKFTNYGDNRRIAAGRIESGEIKAGDDVIFLPSGKKSRVKSIERFNAKGITSASVDEECGLTLEEQIYITRGEVITKQTESAPKVASKILVSIFWLGDNPLAMNKEYTLKIGTTRVSMRLEKIVRVLDSSSLNASTDKKAVEKRDVAECVLKLNKPVVFDLENDIESMRRFVIVSDYEIRGGGIIREAVEDTQAQLRDKVMLRNSKWEKSSIPFEQRAERYGQKPTLILITGEKNVGKKRLAKELENRLFLEGKVVYFLGIGNVLYGIDADIKSAGDGANTEHRKEHLRRLAEVAYIMLEAGHILIVTAVSLTDDDLEIMKTALTEERVQTVWLGDKISTDISYDIHIPTVGKEEESMLIIKEHLQHKGIIFKIW